METVPLELIFDYEDHRENFKKFHDRKHNVFHSTLIIVLAAKTIDTLRTTKSLVMQKLRGKLILAESPQWNQKETFLLAQPFPGWKPYASIEIFSETAAVLAPLRTPNHTIDPIEDRLVPGKVSRMRIKTFIPKAYLMKNGDK